MSSSFSTKTTSQCDWPLAWAARLGRSPGPLARATHRESGHRYVRLLGAFYMRLTGKPVETYQYLEPLLNDYRKVRYLNAMGSTLPWLGCGPSHRSELTSTRSRPQSMRLRTWMRSSTSCWRKRARSMLCFRCCCLAASSKKVRWVRIGT